MNVVKQDLVRLYEQNSKHSAYQILPPSLKRIIGDQVVQVIPRFEAERFAWLKSKLDFAGLKIVDIGGNTGYFTFESLDSGANQVVYIEGNVSHSIFVSKATALLEANVKIVNKYFDFNEDLKGDYFDIVLLFNVIHHLGDDFGDPSFTKSQALEKMKSSINYFADKTERLVLQIGFCWKGDRNQLLFENGTKSEMLEFIKDTVDGIWELEHVGIAEVQGEETVFVDMAEANLVRKDTMGEFRNRPILILKNLKS